VVGLIDLGLVGRLNEELRDKAVDLMLAAVSGDPRAVADALLAMGRPRGKVDLPAFRAEVEVLAGRYLGRPLAEVELAALINDLVKGAVRFDIEMPAELMMIGKALMTIEGIGKQLDPALDPWTELRPYFTQLVMDRYSPQRLGRELWRGARALGRGAGALPGQVHDILEDLRAGRLVVTAADPARALATERLGRRLFAAIVGAALLGAGTTLLAVDRHPGVATAALGLAALVVVTRWWADRRAP
jgi:ubiquinone biosynthesis protein